MDDLNLLAFTVKPAGLFGRLMGKSGETQTILAAAPAREDDCLWGVWNRLAKEQGLGPGRIEAIHTDWELSEEDREFLAAEFPKDLKLTFEAARPADEEAWIEALEAAAGKRGKAALEKRTTADGAYPLLPVVRSAEGVPAGAVSKPLIDDLVVCLGRVARAPRGGPAVVYVEEKDAGEAQWKTALGNAVTGLQVTPSEDEDGGSKYFVLLRAEGLATAILASGGLAEQVSKWVESSRFCAGWSNPDVLTLWNPDDPKAAEIQERVLADTREEGYPLAPMVLLFEDGAPSVLARG